MGIDILSLQPNVISRDLRGKYLLLAGAPRSLSGRLIGNNQQRNAEKNWKAEMLIRGEGLTKSAQPQRIDGEKI